jgi:hypothetical protein
VRLDAAGADCVEVADVVEAGPRAEVASRVEVGRVAEAACGGLTEAVSSGGKVGTAACSLSLSGACTRGMAARR